MHFTAKDLGPELQYRDDKLHAGNWELRHVNYRGKHQVEEILYFRGSLHASLARDYKIPSKRTIRCSSQRLPGFAICRRKKIFCHLIQAIGNVSILYLHICNL